MQKVHFSAKRKETAFRRRVRWLKEFFKIPKSGFRWCLQESVVSFLLFIFFLFVDPISNSFREAGLSALVLYPITLEPTAGGTLHKNLVYMIFIILFASFALSMHSLIILNESWEVVYALTTLGAGLLPLPSILIRALHPPAQVGIPTGVSIGENVLLGCLVLTVNMTPELYTMKLIFAISISCITVVLVSYFVMPNHARNSVSLNLSESINILADILDPVVSSGSIMQKSSLNALFTPYPQIHSTLIHCFHSLNDLNDVTPERQLPKNRSMMTLQDSKFLNPSANLLYDPQSVHPIQNARSSSFGLSSVDRRRTLFTTSEKAGGLDESFEDISYYLKIFEIHKMECARMLSNIQKCNKIFENQVNLITAANREFNYKSLRNWFFPKTKYLRILEEVKTLYTHISCFVYTLNLGLKTAERSIMNFKKPNSASAGALYNSTSKFNFDFCDNNLSFGGTELHTVTFHIVRALRSLATTLKARVRVSDQTLKLVQVVGDSLNKLSSHRLKQHDEFANIVFQCFKADISHSWTPQTPLNWEKAFFIDSKTLMKMSDSEKKTFWDTYWLGRDRVSLVEQTLYTVYANLRNLCIYIDDYIYTEVSYKNIPKNRFYKSFKKNCLVGNCRDV